MSDKKTILDISWKTIFKIFIGITLFYLIYLIGDVLIWFIFATIISILLNPAIDFFQKKRIPRVIGVIFIYTIIFGILGYSFYKITPLFIKEIKQFSFLFPQYFEKITPPLKQLGITTFENIESFIEFLEDNLVGVSKNIFNAIFAIFGGIFATFTILALSIFLSLEERGIEKAIISFIPRKYDGYILNLWKKYQQKVVGWFGLRILCCIFVGISSFLVLKGFNINYASSLALFAGIADFIPILGPLIAGIIIGLIALLDSWSKAILVIVFFILIQQIEGNIITPILGKKFIQLPPILILLTLLIGGKLLGILGAVLAVPVIGILFEILKDFLRGKKEAEIL